LKNMMIWQNWLRKIVWLIRHKLRLKKGTPQYKGQKSHETRVFMAF
jgi:hypothetical protein